MILAYLSDELDLDALVFKLGARLLEGYVHFSRNRLPVVVEKVFLLLPVFRLDLGHFAVFRAIENYVDVRTLPEPKKCLQRDDAGRGVECATSN